MIPGLAYDRQGSGTPVVFLHGLTFTRQTWRPVIEQLTGSVTSIAIDLPAHGDSRGEPVSLEAVTGQIHQLLQALEIERPVLVGHSMFALAARLYAATYPARGVVMVDQATEILPFAQMLHQIAPMLRGPGFSQVWASIESSLGLDLVPEPQHSLVLASHKVDQGVVLSYWKQVLESDPDELQAWIDTKAGANEVPHLVVLGRPATSGERERFSRLSDVHIEEWEGDGHFPHLVDPQRFVNRLLSFVQHCGP